VAGAPFLLTGGALTTSATAMTAMHTETQRPQVPVSAIATATATAAQVSEVQEHADPKVTAKDVQQRQAEGTPITTKNNVDEQDEQDDPDDDYNEEEDEDYIGEDAKGAATTEKSTNGVKVADVDDKDNDDDDDDEEDYIEEEDKREMAKYSSIESSTGGLIKTRKQRLTEELEEKKKKKDLALKSTSGGSSGVNIDSIWAELNSTKPQIPQAPQAPQVPRETSSISTSTSNSTPIASSSEQSSKANSPSTQTPLEQEKIKITSTYEFAGKTVTEEKWVDTDSQEAKAYLNSAKLTSKLESDKATSTSTSTAAAAAAENGTPKKPLLRRKRKRESLLDAVISNSSKTKLSTLEKSRLDWATYVDKNKINDELKYKNKSGFLEKQDFLNRVESRRDDLYKNAKSKSQKE
jgi:hypothetical protein